MLDLGWVPRDQNLEANTITDSSLSDFFPKKEVKVDLVALDFQVLKQLLGLGDDFNVEREQERQAAAVAAG